MKKRILGTLVAAAVIAILALPAQAGCLPDKLFGTWDFTDGVYYYVTWAPGSATDPAQTVGALYEPGNRTLNNEGAYDVTNWLGFYAGYGWYISGALGSADVVGCAAGNMVLAVTDPTPADGTTFVVSWANEVIKANNYDYPDLVFASMPAPFVVNSTRSTPNVILDLQFDDPGPGFSSRYSRTATEAINEIVLYQAKGTNPGRNAADWSEIGRFPYAGGVVTVDGFTLDCSDNTTTFLAAGLNLTGEYDTAHVAPMTIPVECDPTLADPDSKFDLIRERGKGDKRGKPFRDN
mgnify:FL=1